MKRRDFVKMLPMGFGAAATLPLLSGNAKALGRNKLLDALSNPLQETDKVLVIIFLQGGNDGLNTIIPFTDPQYDKFRANTGFVSLAEKKRLTNRLSDTLAFNPYIDGISELWKEGKMAIVQNVGMMNPDLSHFRATDIWNSACDHDQLLDTGWIGRWFELEYPNYPDIKPQDPLAIAMGSATSGSFQGRKSSVEVLVKDPTHYLPIGVQDGLGVPPTLGGNELKFVRELAGISDFYGARFGELFPKHAKNMVEYPKENSIADQLKQIVWCINAGIKTRVYFTEFGSFDTHFNQYSKDAETGGHAMLLKAFSEAVYAYQQDLKAFGLEDRVITMTYSEFGRRAWENGGHSSGTDHGTAAPHFVIGTQVNAGLYGHNPDLHTLDDNGDPLIEFEFRQMYASVMGDWFGVSKETTTAVLSPDRDRAPFETEFPLNDGSGNRPLIRKSSTGVPNRAGQRTFKLYGNYPNPASYTTRVKFELERSSNVRLDLFDTRGALLSTVINTRLGAGEHTPELRTAELVQGAYVYRLTVDGESETRRLNVIR